MTDPDEHYGVNTIPPMQWALDLYFKKRPKSKDPGAFDIIFKAGEHKERMRKKGDHEIFVTYSNRELFVRARCSHDKECEFNSERLSGRDRESLKTLDWELVNDRTLFIGMRKLLVRLNLDFLILIRALNTMCDRRVEIPLTTKWGKTFQKFDDYRRNRWPEDVIPDDKPRFIEEVLVRVCFWIMSASVVGALKEVGGKEKKG